MRPVGSFGRCCGMAAGEGSLYGTKPDTRHVGRHGSVVCVESMNLRFKSKLKDVFINEVYYLRDELVDMGEVFNDDSILVIVLA